MQRCQESYVQIWAGHFFVFPLHSYDFLDFTVDFLPHCFIWKKLTFNWTELKCVFCLRYNRKVTDPFGLGYKKITIAIFEFAVSKVQTVKTEVAINTQAMHLFVEALCSQFAEYCKRLMQWCFCTQINHWLTYVEFSFSIPRSDR